MENKIGVSLIIPMFNEEKNILPVLEEQSQALTHAKISHEILAIDDFSTDHTSLVVSQSADKIGHVELITNQHEKGYAGAIKTGIQNAKGDYFVVVTGDGADFPEDVVKFFHSISEHNFDFVFGSRFKEGGKTYNYPKFKLLINRLGNRLMQLSFWTNCDDLSNSFKMYRNKFVQDNISLESNGFEITIELALKALNKSRNYCVIPNSWKNRAEGYSKMNVLKVIPRFFNMYTSLLKARLS